MDDIATIFNELVQSVIACSGGLLGDFKHHLGRDRASSSPARGAHARLSSRRTCGRCTAKAHPGPALWRPSRKTPRAPHKAAHASIKEAPDMTSLPVPRSPYRGGDGERQTRSTGGGTCKPCSVLRAKEPSATHGIEESSEVVKEQQQHEQPEQQHQSARPTAHR